MSLLLAFQGAAGISGTLAVTEGADAASFTASEIFTGALAATDGADTAGFSGAEIFLGALAVTEGADLAAFGGTVAAAGFTGDLAAVEGADEFAAPAVVEILITTRPALGGMGYPVQPERRRKRDEPEPVLEPVEAAVDEPVPALPLSPLRRGKALAALVPPVDLPVVALPELSVRLAALDEDDDEDAMIALLAIVAADFQPRASI